MSARIETLSDGTLRWVANDPAYPGIFGHGRTLDEASDALRRMIAAYLEPLHAPISPDSAVPSGSSRGET